MNNPFGNMNVGEVAYSQQLTNLGFWFPILVKLGIPVPETYIIHNNLELLGLLDGEKIEGIEKLIDDIDYYARKVGYPCFLRTGQSSDKHSWKDTCFLERKEDIISHLYALQEYSFMADMFLPRSMDTIVVRKIIETEPIFHFFNEMPITREVRIFLKNGKVESIHPYWPLEAFKQYSNVGLFDSLLPSSDNEINKKKEVEKYSDKEIRENVKRLNTFSRKDILFFKAIGKFLAKSFYGYWSVDFLQDKNGEWICIDMAQGDNSYKNKESIG